MTVFAKPSATKNAVDAAQTTDLTWRGWVLHQSPCCALTHLSGLQTLNCLKRPCKGAEEGLKSRSAVIHVRGGQWVGLTVLVSFQIPVWVNLSLVLFEAKLIVKILLTASKSTAETLDNSVRHFGGRKQS